MTFVEGKVLTQSRRMYTQYFQPHPFLITLTQKGNVNELKKKK